MTVLADVETVLIRGVYDNRQTTTRYKNRPINYRDFYSCKN